MQFSDYCGGKSLANCPKCCLQRKTKLPFHSGSNKLTFGFGHARKAKFRDIDFSFSFFYSPFFFILILFFPLVAGLSLDFIYEVKVSQKMLKKVKFLTKSGKW